jgi:hypothetical protein
MKTRKLKRSRRRGGFLANLAGAVKEGAIKGFKQAPKQIYKSLKNSGSSYLKPSGSIANYAGNNIQNILQQHENNLRLGIRSGLQNIKKSLTTKNKSASPISRNYTQHYKLKQYNNKFKNSKIYKNKTFKLNNIYIPSAKNQSTMSNMSRSQNYNFGANSAFSSAAKNSMMLQ